MSRVLICGGNGQVSKLLIPLISKKYTVTALIRDSAQSSALSQLGATPRVFSLESASINELRSIVSENDIIVFAAGAGGKGGESRTRAVDRDAAISLIRASQSLGENKKDKEVGENKRDKEIGETKTDKEIGEKKRDNQRQRFIMLSALTSRTPTSRAHWWTDEDAAIFEKGYAALKVYHECKVAADEALMRSNLRWTIVRPGTLSNDDATGKIRAGHIHLREKTITRGDVARVMHAVIENEETVGLNIDILQGEHDIVAEIARVAKKRETSYELE